MSRATVDPATSVEELLEQLDISPSHVGEVLAELSETVGAAAAEIARRRDEGDPSVFPSIEMEDVLAGSVDDATRDTIRRAGCVVVRSTFPRAQAEAWDGEISEYLERNDFARRFAARNGDATTASILPIYWSRPQVLARQHPRMGAVRRFLNGLWESESDGVRWFEPDRDIGYPDRIRRRAPGTRARGLSAHVDSPSAGGWRIPENQRVFAPLLTDGSGGYDPFAAAHRTSSDVRSPAGSTVFRTFQGWTALSEMHPEDGVLHVVPIPAAVGYRLVHGLAGELGLLDGDPTPAPRRDAGDELVLRALVPIPAVDPGDTVWWHGDLFHAVADATNDGRWGNVMYIGAAPACDRNDAYLESAFARFSVGVSPRDFPAEDYEVDFVDRATVDDLDPAGPARFALPRS